MADPITVVVTFKIKNGRQKDFEHAIYEHLPSCVSEKGVVRFWIHRDPEDSTRYLFFEDWADRAAFNRSLRAAWRGPYMKATEHLWEEPRITTIWKRLPTPWDPEHASQGEAR